VRFTAMDGVTLLPCWMETPISDNATFWVKVSDNLSTQSAIIYLYYGNPAANSTSNGTATFDFFDDFNSTTNWDPTGNVTVSCGTLNLLPTDGTPLSYAETNRPWGYDNYRFRFRAATAATENAYYAYPRGTGSFWANPTLTVGNYWYNPLNYVCYTAQGGSRTDPLLHPVRDEMSHVLQVLKSGVTYTATWDDALSGSVSDWTAETGTKIAFGSNLNAPLQVDWVFLAKYSEDPVQGSWGFEEGTGPAAPSPAAVIFWGTQDYSEFQYNLTGGTPERLISYQFSNWTIMDLFRSDGRYGYCADYWGSCTQPDFVYETAKYCEANYDSTVVFYKGHSWEDMHQGILHYGVYDGEGFGIQGFNIAKHDYIKDYNLYGNVSVGMAASGKGEGSHDLVFLWTCGQGSDIHVGTNNTGDPWGMLSCWMHTDANSTMSRDGYALNETNTSGRCFIGFDYLSIWFHAGTGHSNATYGQLADLFFKYLLDGYTVRDALDTATSITRGVDYLRDWEMADHPGTYFYKPPGYEIWDQHANNGTGAWAMSRIRIWGDGDTIIPYN